MWKVTLCILSMAMFSCAGLKTIPGFGKKDTDSTSDESNSVEGLNSVEVGDGDAEVSIAEGTMSGSSVSGSDESLPPGSSLAIGSADEFEGLAEVEGATVYGSPVDIVANNADGQSIHTSDQPLTVNLVIPETASLNLSGTVDFENLCVLLDSTDGFKFVWQRESYQLDESLSRLTLQTTKLGRFQLAQCTEEVKSIFEDASSAGVSGSLRLILAMTIPNIRMAQSPGIDRYCLRTEVESEVIDRIALPKHGEFQSIYLVSDPTLYESTDTFKLVLAYGKSSCEDKAPIGAWNLVGNALDSGSVGGVLGESDGPFPLDGVKINFWQETTGEVAREYCLHSAGQEFRITIQNNLINGQSEATTLFANVKNEVEVHSGKCGNPDGESLLSIQLGDAGASSIDLTMTNVNVYFYDDLTQGIPASSNKTPVDVCAGLISGDKVWTVSHNITANPQGVETGTGLPVRQESPVLVGSYPGSISGEIGYISGKCAAGVLESIPGVPFDDHINLDLE